MYIYRLCYIRHFNFVLAYYIQAGQKISYNPLVLPASKRDAVQIYCYEGKPKYIIHIWQSVSVITYKFF